MTKSSGSPTQRISLPKGGGALHGIGETFSPDLHTGTGNFTIPVSLPPGRNAFNPQLSIGYSSGQGNGPFGLGWSLSIPGISRKTSRGVPRYDDSKDVFILSGAEDLVPVEQPLGPSSYRPRTEGLFAHIQHHRDSDNDYWEVRSKDGLVSQYGSPRPDSADQDWSDPAVIRNPNSPLEPRRIFAWKLTRTTDPFGNRIEYVYKRDARHTDGPHHWDQVYLSEIRYVDYGPVAAHTFLVTVRFIYEQRPDPFSDYRAGFEIRTVQRCTRIEIVNHPHTDVPVRSYHLSYADQSRTSGEPAPATESLPYNRVSLLRQVLVEGLRKGQSESLPALEFGYTRFEPQERHLVPVTGPDAPPVSLADPNIELVDLLGNGLPGVLEMNGSVRYWRNLGKGRFDRPREMPSAPGGFSLADSGVQIIDANGDGRPDLLITTENISGYFPVRFGGSWDRRSFQHYKQAPSFDLEDPEVKLVDLDGDGITDAVRSGSRLEYFFNDPKLGWNAASQAERRSLDVFPNVNFSDPRVKFADMTGDGLQDIVLVHQGHVEYWPSLGRGNWGKRVSMRNSPRFPFDYDPKRILIDDVDGDGAADIVYVDDRKVTLWINQSGNGWSEPIEIHGTPPVSNIDSVRLTDLFGVGVAGVLWSETRASLSRPNMFFLDFTGSVKPYLLDEMNNNIGSVTHVGYASSTRFYLNDEEHPESRWKTSLPFPVQVVARVEVIDEISGGKLTTEYDYHHGYWDGAEREFRGFGRVDHRDTEVFADYHDKGLHSDGRSFDAVAARAFSPPTEMRTWFHQGPTGDEFGEWEETNFSGEFWREDHQALLRPPSMQSFLRGLPRRAKRDALRTLRGRVLRTELYALDRSLQQDRPYTVTEHLHGVREERDPSAPAPTETEQRIFFPHTLAERTTQWERGEQPMSQFTFTGDYDQYGQSRSSFAIAVPRDRDFRTASTTGEPYLATHTVTSFAKPNDPQVYIVDRVARVTNYEVVNNTNDPISLFTLQEAIELGSATSRIIGQTHHFYDGPMFQGLPAGHLGNYGALVRTENLVLTEEILRDAYHNGAVNPEEPPYLAATGIPAWTPDYPQEFRDGLAISQPVDADRPGLVITPAGLGFAAGADASSNYARGYFAASDQRRYDFQEDPPGPGRGLTKTIRDSLRRETSISYDQFDFLPTQVTDAAGLSTSAEYDYRVMQPRLVVDPNLNRTTFTYTALGLLESTSVTGKEDEGVGDLLTPGTRLVYDFSAFTDHGLPISVRTIRRVHHDSESDVPLPNIDETIEAVEYSDGFGRLLQKRAQAEDDKFGDTVFGGEVLPANQTSTVDDARDVTGSHRLAGPPNVVVTGLQVYDNKGRVVEKYEPYFSVGWDYALPADNERGQKVAFFYDPRGNVIRTVNPDGSEQRVVHGVPGTITSPALSNPDVFEPTPWEAYTYDANDNAERTHKATSVSYLSHWNTPSSSLVDALGRVVQSVERNGASASDRYITTSTYDIQGNLLTVTDPLGRVVYRGVYDLAGRQLRIEQLDAGLRRIVVDAAGNVIEQRDSKGALVLRSFDKLNRPTRFWARDETGQALTLRERLVYGDGADSGLTATLAKTANLLGKMYRHYDEAGLLTFPAYDFKGNLLEKSRQVINDTVILSVFNPPPVNWQVSAFRVDWEPATGVTLGAHAATLLDATEYGTSISYDALNRVKLMRYPRDVSGTRKELTPHYNRAGALESVTLDGTVYVERIAYNAKGQRSLIAFGNGVMTRYAHDAKTFRLTRMRTEQYTITAPLTYHPSGPVFQDFAYEYDLAGNILEMHDRTPASGVPSNPDQLDRTFTYDPIYRLLTTTGRECATPPPNPLWDDVPKCQDVTLTRDYEEQYDYDKVGNITLLSHNGGAAATYNRSFTLVDDSNKLRTVTIGSTDYSYAYDDNGNLVTENGSRHFEWDHSDRMRVFRTQPVGSEPSVHAHYLYDASGQRVKKLVRKQTGGVEVTIYIDGVFEHHRLVNSGSTRENNTLHVMDNQSRIAMVRAGAAFPDDGAPDKPVKYHLGDHLGSSNVVLDDSGSLINREEYTPYGETSFGSFARKRYRFTGKERDEESGLYYHGARYFAPWLERWLSCDPVGMVDGVNLYGYSLANPLNLIDASGMQSELPLEEQRAGKSLLGTGAASGAGKQYSELPEIPRTMCVTPKEGANASNAEEYTSWRIFKDAIRQLPESLGQSHEERARDVGAIFEKSGESPEHAAAHAQEYLQGWRNLGFLTGALAARPLAGASGLTKDNGRCQRTTTTECGHTTTNKTASCTTTKFTTTEATN
jgi:RHS repeat-associated protein